MDKKKKVAILLPWLKMGGTNKVAINFMKELVAYCDVTLILSQNVGELLPQIPDGVHLLVDDMQDFRRLLKADLKHGRLICMLQDFLYYARIKLGRDSVDNYRYLVNRQQEICGTEFDCAISYHGQSPEQLMNLLYRVHSKKKIAWIHGEMAFSNDKCHRLKKYFEKLDHFFFISQMTWDSFARVLCVDDAHATIYYNPNDREDVLLKSKLPCDSCFSKDYINLLTVGRISAEKGQDMIPAITRNLLDFGYNVRWYIIGDGDMRSHVAQLVTEFRVSQNVIFLGTQVNPYNYMKACDLYVQPSYTEGYSATICEAGMLGKPVVCTNNCGIRERIIPGEDALFVDSTVSALTEGISYLLRDQHVRDQYANNIKKNDFEGKGEIRKFLDYLDG